MLEPVRAGVPMTRAFLRVGGRAIARHQLEFALALECQRIVCIARAVTAEVIDLQRRAEREGASFHVIDRASAMVGQVTANDDLIVLADGLLPDLAEGRAFVADGHAVSVQPVEEGLARGFERVDINHATAGIMRIPGRLVEHLAALPGDCDVVSALTRIALQNGVRMRTLAVAGSSGPAWRIIRDDEEAHGAEGAWIGRQLAGWDVPLPGLVLARSGLLAFGPALLHRGSAGRSAFLLALLVLAISLGAGWFGLTGLGLLLCGMAWIVVRGAAVLRRIEHPAREGVRDSSPGESALLWLVDAVMIAVIVWRAPLMPWQSVADAVFAPLVLMGLLRLLPAVLERKRAAWLEDRSIFALLFALLAALGLLSGALPLLAIALLAGGLAAAARQSRLTTD